MVNDLYITICYRPIIDKTSGFFARFEKPKFEERLEQQEAYVQKINDITSLLLTGLRAYEPIRLGVMSIKGVCIASLRILCLSFDSPKNTSACYS
ncbi:Uncharacterised protein [Moraxella caprae]|uniref:Uncharacterized protein n=1 Tax=Moraxella caprae TaxID=90240 RepID=A0A378QL37_9GAMM|nr:hypothetical protein [Moraxella caprae]STZ01586.1 Uncharacterised protein [Moraxella caprae]